MNGSQTGCHQGLHKSVNVLLSCTLNYELPSTNLAKYKLGIQHDHVETTAVCHWQEHQAYNISVGAMCFSQGQWCEGGRLDCAVHFGHYVIGMAIMSSRSSTSLPSKRYS